MGRPERRDVDYFPFLVKDGKTLFILEGKYGCKGTGFFTNVMRFLCRTPDHHFQIMDDSDQLYFFAKCHCDEESGLDMLNIMAKTGKICSDMWVSYKVIVSEDLLNSIKDAYRNRQGDIITIDQIRVSYTGNKVSDDGNPVEDGITDVNNPQSKVKESKVKKKKTIDPLFDSFYSAYPKHVARSDALKAWMKLSPKNGTVEQIMQSLELHKNTTWKSLDPKYIPNPATWLNGRRWEDEPIVSGEQKKEKDDELPADIF